MSGLPLCPTCGQLMDTRDTGTGTHYACPRCGIVGEGELAGPARTQFGSAIHGVPFVRRGPAREYQAAEDQITLRSASALFDAKDRQEPAGTLVSTPTNWGKVGTGILLLFYGQLAALVEVVYYFWANVIVVGSARSSVRQSNDEILRAALSHNYIYFVALAIVVGIAFAALTGAGMLFCLAARLTGNAKRAALVSLALFSVSMLLYPLALFLSRQPTQSGAGREFTAAHWVGLVVFGTYLGHLLAFQFVLHALARELRRKRLAARAMWLTILGMMGIAAVACAYAFLFLSMGNIDETRNDQYRLPGVTFLLLSVLFLSVWNIFYNVLLLAVRWAIKKAEAAFILQSESGV